MKLQFAGIREQYLVNDTYLRIYKQTSANGFATSGSIYLTVQGENRVGLNLPTTPVLINYSIGDEIVVELKPTLITKAEDVHAFVISANTVNDTNFFQIGKYKPTILPYSFIFNRTSQLLINEAVALPSDLPTTNLKNGMIRIVSSLSSYFEYYTGSIATVDNINVIYDNNGRWIKRSNPYTYIVDTETVLGCNINFDTLDFNTDILHKPTPYLMDATDGVPVKYWYINNTSYPVPAGTQIGINVYLNNENSSIVFSGKLKTILHGYTNVIAGELDTSDSTGLFQMQYIDVPVLYTPGRLSNLTLQKDLPVGEGLVVSIYPSFHASEVNNQIAPNSKLHCEFFNYLLSGTNTTIGTLTGNIIYQHNDLRRIVPGLVNTVIGLSGSGVVNNVEFTDVQETVVTDLISNTANQSIVITGDGILYLEASGYKPKITEDIRAKVSTTAGESTYISKTLNVTSSNKSIIIDVDNPVNVTGHGIVRSDYPDVIASNNKGDFNPPYVVVYLNNGTTIYRYETLAVVSDIQTIEISSLSGLTTVTSIPVQSDIRFSLYKVDDIKLTEGTFGSIPVANYTIHVGYRYTGDEVTAISHAVSDGCIKEWAGNIADVGEIAKYWSTPVTTTTVRGVTADKRWNGQVRVIQDKLWPYYYNAGSTATDDGLGVFKPNDVDIADGGRWLELPRVDIELILEQLKNLDGAGSGLDADLLDGNNSTYFATATALTALQTLLDNHNHDTDYAPLVHTHPLASGVVDGLMSSANFTKLAGLPDSIPETALLSVFGRTGAVVANIGDYTAEQIIGLSPAATQPYGAEANTVCQGNDTRLSNARTPTGSANGTNSDIEGTYPDALVLKSIGTAGTYSGVTVDAKGRVTSGTTTVTEANLPSNIAYVDAVNIWQPQQRRTILPVISAAIIDIDVSTSTSFKLLLQHDAIITLTNGVEGDSIMLYVQNEGGRTLNISNGHFVEELVIPSGAGTKTKIYCEFVFGIWMCDYPGAGLYYG